MFDCAFYVTLPELKIPSLSREKKDKKAYHAIFELFPRISSLTPTARYRGKPFRA